MIIQVVTFKPNETAKKIITRKRVKSKPLTAFEKLSDLFGHPIDKKASLTTDALRDRLITQ